MAEFSISLDNATVGDVFDMMSAISSGGEDTTTLSAYLPFMDRFTKPSIVVAELPAKETSRIFRFIMEELIPMVQAFDADDEKN